MISLTQQQINLTLTVVPVFQNAFPESYRAILETLNTQGRFKAEAGTLYHWHQLDSEILFLGLGNEDKLDLNAIKSAFASGLVKLKAISALEVSVAIEHLEQKTDVLRAAFEGLLLKAYKFNNYKTPMPEEKNVSLTFFGFREESLRTATMALAEVKAICEGVNLARDLVNEPSNVIYPATLAEAAQKAGKESGFEVEVLDELAIEQLGMKAFMSVAMGSELPPRLIIMRYNNNPESEERLGLIGKGLTYDSGGYAIKPADGMVTMKSDMGGAASVIGTMTAIAKMQLKVNVTAVVAACENMISGHAYRNGDIIGSMAGKFIEIINTDAEGRLTLIDAVTYTIQKENVTKLVDVATLTGAALVALGLTTTAVISNDNEFYRALEEASIVAGERVWQLPIFDEYKKLYKSDIADFKNSGGRFAGTIGAGMFIGEFVEGKPWLHLDIAGTSWTDGEQELGIKGGTGAPVRTLYQLIKQM